MSIRSYAYSWSLLVVVAACGMLGLPRVRSAEAGEDAARSILDKAGVTGGVVVHLGCSDGRLTAALHVSDHLLVHGLARDPADVDQARRYIQSRGLYGPVSVDRWTGPRLPYADNLVNLIVVSDEDCKVSDEEMQRVLCPGGSCVLVPTASSEFKAACKPWPAELDEWTHWLHDASGNAVGQDSVVGPPRQFQWAAGPLWSRHHNTVPSVSAMVSASGRVFTIVDEGPPGMAGTTPDKWFLTARDAFNGVELWRRPMQQWGWRAWSLIWNERFNQPNNVPKRLVAAGDRVFVTLGFNSELTALDAATGQLIRRYEGTEFTDEILYQDGLLILSINDQAQGPGEVKDKPPVTKHVAVIDAVSGERRWSTGAFVGNSAKTGSVERETHLLLAAKGDQVFMLDRDSVISLDLQTGEQLWKSPRPESPDYTSRYHHRMSEMCTLVATDDVILLCQLEPIQKRIGWRVIKARLQAYDARSGDPMWEYRCGNWGHFCVPDLFVAQGTAWVHDKETMTIIGLDLKTGEELHRQSTEKALDNGHHHRCYRNKATEQYLITSFRGLEYIDWASGDIDRNHWVRGTCRYGVMPCNGLTYSTPHPCDCYVTSKLNGFYALAPEGASAADDATGDAGKRLERGPAYDLPIPSSIDSIDSKSEWPAYRHDAQRTGCGGVSAPSALTVAWQATLPGGRITAPVAAEGKVLAASIGNHAVYALDKASGGEVWSYTACGPIDTPPTIWNGRAFFGCHDGWVYCLRMSDGALIWRFRAAPAERLVVAYGRLESAWPVHGSVLIRDGKAYFTAGRSSFLDGGIAAYCLDATTGELLAERQIAHQQDMNVDAGRNQNDDTGVLSDVLVSEGKGVFMRHFPVFGADEDRVGWGRRVGSTAGMLDDSWFNRTMWLVDGRDYGELLVHDDAGVYSVRLHKSRGHGDYIVPGTNAYQVVAADRMGGEIPDSNRHDALSNTLWPRPKKTRWSLPLPTRVIAMAVGGDTLLCAGTPDRLEAEEPWAAYEGKRGGTLYAIATEDGTKRAELPLKIAPVYDGMAVAYGKLYLSTVDGTLMCIGDE